MFMMNFQHTWTRRPLSLPTQACASRAAGSPEGLFQCAPRLEEACRTVHPGGAHICSQSTSPEAPCALRLIPSPGLSVYQMLPLKQRLPWPGPPQARLSVVVTLRPVDSLTYEPGLLPPWECKYHQALVL